MPAAWFGLARLYLITEEYEKAQTWAQKILKYKPENKLVSSYLDQATAKDNSAVLEEIRTTKAKRYLTTAWNTARRGDNQGAIRLFQNAIENDADDIAALNGLGYTFLSSRQHDKAKPLFQKCIRLMPKHYAAANGLARCLKAEGKTTEALQVWEEIEQAIPGPSAGTVGLAMTYLELKDYENAIKYLKILANSTVTKSNDRFRELLKKA